MTQPEPQTLSSSLTPALWLLPVLWLAASAPVAVLLFVAPSSARSGLDAPIDTGTRWGFVVAAFLGTGLLWVGGTAFKKVRMDEASLYISNYSRHIVVPLVNVAEVTEVTWINVRPVTIIFHSVTPFGSAVVFMPSATRSPFLSSTHPVVEEIRRAVIHAKGKGPSRMAP